MNIYKPSAKAIKKGIYVENQRLILRQGCAILFDISGKIIQSDVSHGKADSHLTLTNESVDNYKFTISKYEYEHAKRHNLSLPENTKVMEQ